MLRYLLLVGVLTTACAAPVVEEAPFVWDGDLAALQFSFTDPGTRSRYRIEGPYRVVKETRDGIELETFDADFFEPVRLLVFQRNQVLWALARVDGQEFLTRLD